MLSWVLAGSLPVALTLVAVTAVLEGPVMASVFTVRQQRTPSGLQAQVMGTLGSVQIAAFSLGTALGGPVVVALGPQSSILVAASTILSAGAIGVAVRAGIRDRVAHAGSGA
jgi:hypothetical protein